jgi:hypothetical protein
MNELLQLAISAHGGLGRWNQTKSVNIQAAITGGIWYVKGRPDVLKNISVYLETQQEKVIIDFPGHNKKTIFEPQLISIAESDGSILQSFVHPISSFEGQTRETRWDDVHVAYFSGEALWTYLTIPFLYTYPGFITEEIEPWQENGETWRRLKVTFPDYISSHSLEQISFFGPDGLLRRHDYTVDILGGATGANYASNYRDIDGIIVPATRRIYAYEGNHIAVKNPLLVAIDMEEITFNDK